MKMTVASSGYKGKSGVISSGDTFAMDDAILLETGSLGTGNLVSIEISFE